MRKILPIVLAVAFLAVVVMAVAVSAQEAPKVPAGKEVLTFEPEKGKVTLSHQSHSDKLGNCTTCHHKAQAGETPKPCAGEGCHTLGKTEPKDDNDMYDANHDKVSERSCVGCHKTRAKGPTKCNDCHEKK